MDLLDQPASYWCSLCDGNLLSQFGANAIAKSEIAIETDRLAGFNSVYCFADKLSHPHHMGKSECWITRL